MTCRVVWLQHENTEGGIYDGDICDALNTSPLTGLSPPPLESLSPPRENSDSDAIGNIDEEEKGSNHMFYSSKVYILPEEVLHVTTAALRIMRMSKINFNRIAMSD